MPIKASRLKPVLDQKSQMMSEKNPVVPNEDNLTIKELLIKGKDWGAYFLRKWKLITICTVIGAALGIGYSMLGKIQYVAELTFVVEETKSGGLGAYAGIASQFGVDLGSAGSSGLFSGENILQFLKSRLMVEKTLLSPIQIDDKTISLADYYMSVTNFKKGWDKIPSLQKLYFPPEADRRNFTRAHDSVLNVLYGSITKKSLSVSKIDKKLSFVSVVCTTQDERFSQAFVTRLVEEATEFYVKTKTQKSQVNVDILQHKADSLASLLSKATYSVASSQDLNLNPSRRVALVSSELKQVDKAVLQTMYGEVLKNLELSRFHMAQETPIVQLVDLPILPLRKEKFGKLKGLMLGGILASLLISIFLAGRKFYDDVMQQD